MSAEGSGGAQDGADSDGSGTEGKEGAVGAGDGAAREEGCHCFLAQGWIVRGGLGSTHNLTTPMPVPRDKNVGATRYSRSHPVDILDKRTCYEQVCVLDSLL